MHRGVEAIRCKVFKNSHNQGNLCIRKAARMCAGAWIKFLCQANLTVVVAIET